MTFLVSDDGVEVFATAIDALTAAVARRAGGTRHLRIALTTGDARRGVDGSYVGAAQHRGACLLEAAQLGQTLLSSVTASLVTDALPEGCALADLGVHRLRDLSQPDRIFELVTPDGPQDARPLGALDSHPNNLPVQLTSFVGRSFELKAVQDLLSTARLVTLAGPGGSGKTRLAMQVAAELADRWPDGVWWVELGSGTDTVSVAEPVASAVGVLVEPLRGPLRALAVQLRDRRLLLCLDNCEHRLDAVADLVETLLRACPDVSILTTSREPLGIAGEIVWRVPALGDDDAAALFIERASQVRPWLTIDATDEALVRAICRRLDGIPLAIELAAAWLGSLTLAQLAARLDDRLALLVRGPRGAVARQQTLAASIAWSHDLLDDVDRRVFRRLAVFSGGFTLDAACAVCAALDIDAAGVFDSVGRLVDKSLIAVDDFGGEGRYRLLETIRQFAAGQLAGAGEEAAVRHRHLDYFVGWAETAEHGLVHVDQDAWLPRLAIERENLRAALDWALDSSDPSRARRLAAAMVWLWYLHGLTVEGLEYLRTAIALSPDERTSVQAKLYCGIAGVAVAGGQFNLIAESAQRAYEIATEIQDATYTARALFLLATAQSYVDFDASWRLCEEALRHADEAGDPFVAGAGRVLQGTLLSHRERYDEARLLLHEGFERCMRPKHRYFAAISLNYQDDEALMTGDVPRACALAEQALSVAEPLGDYYSVGQATAHLALARGFAGEIDDARGLMSAVVRSMEGADPAAYVPRLAPVLGKLSLWVGDYEGAAAWFERDVRHADPLSPSLIVARSLPGLADALRHLGRLDEARECAERAVSIARRLGMWHIFADALEQSGFLAELDDAERAEDLHHAALATRAEHGLRTFYVDSLDALAALAVRAESPAEAVRVLAASTMARSAMSYPRRPVHEPGYDEAVEGLRSTLGAGEFSATWAQGASLSLDDAVAYVRRARGTRHRPTTGWASLTPTELDVVRLVVEGLSNPEIGTRMFISRGTVKTHLSHIFAKLGVTSRTGLARIAVSRMEQRG